jgi:hypothetical protein
MTPEVNVIRKEEVYLSGRSHPPADALAALRGAN